VLLQAHAKFRCGFPYRHRGHESDICHRFTYIVDPPEYVGGDVQVNIVQTGLLEARFDRSFGLFIAHRSLGDFSSEEDFRSGYSAFSDGIRTGPLVPIRSG